MNLKAYFLFINILLVFQLMEAQEVGTNLNIEFKLIFKDEPLLLNKKYLSDKKDTLEIVNFKFYLSNFEIEYNDNSILKEKNSVHLLDIKKPVSSKLLIPNDSNKIISKIHFDIGIDSLSSVSGAMEGDLDPMNGMYWSWQSGYINMKLEGKSPSCATPKKEFQFHIGGYESPNYAIRRITLENKKGIENIKIKVDLAKIFAILSLRERNSVMSPGKEAMIIADTSIQLFSVE